MLVVKDLKENLWYVWEGESSNKEEDGTEVVHDKYNLHENCSLREL